MAGASKNTRTETDALGSLELPQEVYYGIHTARSLANFPISGIRVHRELIKALALTKKAAARVNVELGLLETEIGRAVVRAADEVAAGELDGQFVVDVFQMGAGTSLNMNMNEVLANRAIELLGGTKGDYIRVHPNDHVNMAQSTNDVYPTAMRVASRFLMEGLVSVVGALSTRLSEKGAAFQGIVKSARTHLQDAVPIRLGQEFAAYGGAVARCREEIVHAARGLEELGIGGSAAGTGLNVAPPYRAKVVELLKEWYGLPFRPAPDLREAMQSNLCISRASGALRLLCLEITRIANDLRLLSSGPTTGLSEIRLPAVQPGSSIMPGKVNPSILEMVNMVCFQVLGNDATIAAAVQAGQLDLNVMMPVMSFNLIQSVEILTSSLAVMEERCVRGIAADAERCRLYAEQSMALATALNPHIGYARAAEVAKEALRTGKTVVEVVRARGLLDEEQIRESLDPARMTGE